MLTLPILAAAAVLVPPAPGGHDLVTNDNYPKWALERDKSAGVIYAAFVTPDGTIAKCVVQASRGDAQLANEVCQMVERRRMKPAIDSQGRNAYGVYTNVVNFVLTGTAGAAGLPIDRGPDAEFTVTALPGGISSPSDARVNIEVGADGVVDHCSPAADDAGALAGLACRQLSGAKVGPMKLGEDQQVPYVQAMTVRFKTGA